MAATTLELNFESRLKVVKNILTFVLSFKLPHKNLNLKKVKKLGLHKLQKLTTSGALAGVFSCILNSGVVLSVISLSLTGTRMAKNFSPTFMGFPS
jgi:hypothetical protein